MYVCVWTKQYMCVCVCACVGLSSACGVWCVERKPQTGKDLNNKVLNLCCRTFNVCVVSGLCGVVCGCSVWMGACVQ